MVKSIPVTLPCCQKTRQRTDMATLLLVRITSTVYCVSVMSACGLICVFFANILRKYASSILDRSSLFCWGNVRCMSSIAMPFLRKCPFAFPLTMASRLVLKNYRPQNKAKNKGKQAKTLKYCKQTLKLALDLLHGTEAIELKKYKSQ